MAEENIEVGVENLTIEEGDKTEKNTVLGEKDVNTEESAEVSCGFCKKLGPAKRCGKRHPKCLKKLFCNETCEAAAHKKKEDPATAAKVAAKKAADKKKKAKSKKENNFGKNFSVCW